MIKKKFSLTLNLLNDKEFISNSIFLIIVLEIIFSSFLFDEKFSSIANLIALALIPILCTFSYNSFSKNYFFYILLFYFILILLFYDFNNEKLKNILSVISIFVIFFYSYKKSHYQILFYLICLVSFINILISINYIYLPIEKFNINEIINFIGDFKILRQFTILFNEEIWSFVIIFALLKNNSYDHRFKHLYNTLFFIQILILNSKIIYLSILSFFIFLFIKSTIFKNIKFLKSYSIRSFFTVKFFFIFILIFSSLFVEKVILLKNEKINPHKKDISFELAKIDFNLSYDYRKLLVSEPLNNLFLRSYYYKENFKRIKLFQNPEIYEYDEDQIYQLRNPHSSLLKNMLNYSLSVLFFYFLIFYYVFINFNLLSGKLAFFAFFISLGINGFPNLIMFFLIVFMLKFEKVSHE